MSKTECPHCHTLNEVAPSLIGQYVTCQSCRCKYYVYVPPLETPSVAAPRISVPPTPRTVEGSSVQTDSRVMMRQEALLAEIHEDLIDLRRRITVAALVVIAAAASVIAVLLIR